ncbi:hypothetical protein EG338_02180 [Kaistella haifensis]|nr:hypothetical protein EG338_02180 [Kaistella haifensis]
MPRPPSAGAASFPPSGRAFRYIFFSSGGGAAATEKGCRFYPSRESSVSRSPGFPKYLTFKRREISKKIHKSVNGG